MKSKSTSNWPKVTKGSHLTVTTYENGKTELEWDDVQLAKDVHIAINEYEKTLVSNEIPIKKSRKKKQA
jgi:hypothetical protein